MEREALKDGLPFLVLGFTMKMKSKRKNMVSNRWIAMKMNARLGFMAGFLTGCHEDKGVDGISWQKTSEYAMKTKRKRKIHGNLIHKLP